MKNKNIYISPLQYITQKKSIGDIETEVRSFLTGGGDWVQLRMKDVADSEYLSVAKRIKELCYSFNATFIVNDNLDVAIESGADGIHLGKGDIPTSCVRPIVGKKFIIGRTANTVRDVEILSNQDINYIGLGPYTCTATKENLSPILGIEGYLNIFKSLKENMISFPPIVAIGGITLGDLEELSKVEELSGVAISGAISNSTNPTKSTIDFIQKVEDLFNIKNYNLKK